MAKRFFSAQQNKRHAVSRIICIIGIIPLLVSCSTRKIETLPSHNFSERERFLVMHFTALNYQDSVKALVDEGGLSAHYLIPQQHDDSYSETELKVIQLVDESDRAWHAGSSYWQGREDINDQSIGIEVVNVPECSFDNNSLKHTRREHDINRLCLFPDYDPKQIQLLIELSKDILARNPDIGPTQVVGHSDIAPERKNDPGPRFPWFQLYQAGIGAWYENQTVKYFWQRFNQRLPSVQVIQKALNTYGYNVPEDGHISGQFMDTLSAFQMHFLPWQVTGERDARTAATLYALIEKYMPGQLSGLMADYDAENVPVKALENPVRHGQIDRVFPFTERSSRTLVNDRTTFKGYEGRGELIIDNVNASSADIYINGRKLTIDQDLQSYQRYQYSLQKRTKSGINRLKIDNVLPKGSQIRATIPYPELINTSIENQAKFRKVDALIQADIDAGFPGAVLVVAKDGEIIKRSAYGYSRKYDDAGKLLPRPVKMTSDTMFDLASNTKMFATNLAVMKLISEQKLDISKPVVDYLPDYRGQDRETRIVRDLITHTAGYAPEVQFFNRENRLGEGFFSQDKQSTEALLLSKVPFKQNPINQPRYSDTDYMLLGILVEKITGLPLDKYVEVEIYHPLNLRHARFNPLKKGYGRPQFAATEIQGNTRGGRIHFENIREHTLQGEVHDEKAFYSSQGVAGHAGLFSTATDLAVLSQMLLNGGGYGLSRLIEPSVIDNFTKPEESDGTYGLGWRRAAYGQRKWHFGPYASPLAYGHTGWTGTVSIIDPAYDLSIILLTNSRHSPIVKYPDGSSEFAGKHYETGKFGSVISLIYEAVLDQ